MSRALFASIRRPPEWRRPAFSMALIVLALSSSPSMAVAQGLLVDVRPDRRIPLPRPVPTPHPPAGSYRIDQLSVRASIADAIARVRVSQTFVNTSRQPLEVCFVFPLPYQGAVDSLTLLVDGTEYPARLLAAPEARRLYEAIVRKNQDPALLEWVGSGMFRTNVFPVPPGGKRTVTLRYAQICRRSQGLTDFLFPLSTAKYTAGPVKKLSIEVAISSADPLKSVYSPSLPVTIERPESHRAIVTYTGRDTLPSQDFRLFFDVGEEAIHSSVISYRPNKNEDGYFLLLTTPDVAPTDGQLGRKAVVFAVDRSGSMSGKKMDQAKAALQSVLKKLDEGDLFNIVAYDSEVESFRPELEKVNDKTRDAALGFVAGLYAGGSTNISAALDRVLGMLHESAVPTYVMFLTDGLPTVGETNESRIAANTRRANRVRARLFTFGVGYDVNSRLLDRIAQDNFGQSHYVRPNEDIGQSVGSLYTQIAAPVLTDATVHWRQTGHSDRDGPLVNRIYPRQPWDLFHRQQLAIVGRYRRGGPTHVVVQGTLRGRQQSQEFAVELATTTADESQAFVARLWATRRIGEIIDQLDLEGHNDELVAELVQLATQHGVLTPYTSFLADESTDTRDLAGNAARAGRLASQFLPMATGDMAFRQREAKSELRRSLVPTLNSYAAPAEQGRPTASPLALDRAGQTSAAELRQLIGARAQRVRRVAGKTFYLRDGRWLDATVTAADEGQLEKIERFSDAYFDLARRLGSQVGPYMAFDEPVVVKIDGRVYQW